MIDYKKAEQAKKLLAESGLDYTLAYIGEDNDAIGDVQGKVLKAADCIIAIMQAVGSMFATSTVIKQLLRCCNA